MTIPAVDARCYNSRGMQAVQSRWRLRRVDFRIGEWLIQPGINRVSRAGREVHLRPKLMDVLVFLSSRRGDVVTKEELLAAVWPQLFVEESALSRAVADIRHLLDDDAQDPTIIETIPKRGYRLIAAVDQKVGEEGGAGAGREAAALPFRQAVTPEKPLFAGRDIELGRLADLLEQVHRGTGSVAFVTGEAGTGKTALLDEFIRRAQHRYPDLVVAQSKAALPGPPGNPYAIFRRILSLLTGDVEALFAAGMLSAEQATRLWRLIPESVELLTAVGPRLVGTLIPSAPLIARAKAAALQPADWVEKLEALANREAPIPPAGEVLGEAIDFLQALAGRHPLLLVFDDLQWCDSASAGLLGQLAAEVPGHRLLILGAYRPVDVAAALPAVRHPLEAIVNESIRRSGQSVISLPESSSEEFVNALVDAEPNRLGSAFRRTLFRQTQGHPLFTVELLRAMRDTGTLARDEDGRWKEVADLKWDVLPVRVEAMVAERVARLPRALRRMLDLAAIEGEEFTAEVLAHICGISGQQAVLTLSDEVERRHRLVQLQSVTAVGNSRFSTFRFAHVLTQRYLLAELNPAEKVYLHAAVGDALEALYGDGAGEFAVQLAWHFEQGGNTQKAIEYLRRAGEHALRMGADRNAASHFSAAIALMAKAAPSPADDHMELLFQLALVLPLLRLTSGGAPELHSAVERAYQLALRLPPTPEVFGATTAAMMQRAMRGEYAAAIQAADRSTAVARELGNPSLIAASRWLPAAFRLRTGALSVSRRELESDVATGLDPRMAVGFVHPQIWRLSWLGYVAWFLGYPDQALERVKEAVAEAERMGEGAGLFLALGIETSVLLHRGEGAAAQDALNHALQVGSPVPNPFMELAVSYFQGWSLVLTDRLEEGLRQLDRVIRGARKSGLRLDWTKILATFARASLQAGKLDQARAAVQEGLAAACETGEHYYEPELYRLNGEAMWAAGCTAADVEACFLESLRIARSQSAKSWELWTTMSLARLWAGNGRRSDARAVLEPAYSWFTEGFATPELESARRLLEDLGCRRPQEDSRELYR